MLVVRERGLRTIPKTKVDAIAWWIDFGATTHVCKDRCWFKTFEPVEDESILSSSTVVNSLLWHAQLGHVHYKRMLEMSKDDLIPVIDENPEKCTMEALNLLSSTGDSNRHPLSNLKLSMTKAISSIALRAYAIGAKKAKALAEKMLHYLQRKKPTKTDYLGELDAIFTHNDDDDSNKAHQTFTCVTYVCFL
ncbi:zinc finger, CCHC-type containing protein [Tanacetum coccineum]